MLAFCLPSVEANGEDMSDDIIDEDVIQNEDNEDVSEEDQAISSAAYAKELKAVKGSRDRFRKERDKAKTKLEAAQAQIVDLEARIAEYREIGGDAGELKERFDKLRQFEDGKLADSEIDTDELIRRGMAKQKELLDPKIKILESQLKEKEEEIAKLNSRIREFTVTGRLKSALPPTKQGAGRAAYLALQDATREQDGELIPIDTDGEPVRAENGDIMSLEEFAQTKFYLAHRYFFDDDQTKGVNGPSKVAMAKPKDGNPFPKKGSGDKPNWNLLSRLWNAGETAKLEKYARARGVKVSDYIS